MASLGERRPRQVSEAGKAAIYAGVFAAYGLGIWAASATFRAPLPDNGGAPVVNLTLVALAQFDGQTAPQEAAAAKRAPPLMVRPREITTPPPVPPPPDVSPLSLLPPPPQTPAAEPTQSAPPSAKADAGASAGGSGQPGATGQTVGGGAKAMGASATAAEDLYAAKVLAWVEKHKGRPRREKRGQVIVRFVLDRQGKLQSLDVAASSQDRELDRMAIDALDAAQPYPRPPPGTAWRTREFHVRIEYRPDPS